MKSKNYTSDNMDIPESDFLYKKKSQIKGAGLGLYTAIKIYKGEIFSYYKGEVLSDSQAQKRAQKGKDRYFINLLDGHILDSMHTKCYAKYANDAKGLRPSGFKNNARITLDDANRVCLRAKRNIKRGEEIFCSYGKKYWKKHS